MAKAQSGHADRAAVHHHEAHVDVAGERERLDDGLHDQRRDIRRDDEIDSSRARSVRLVVVPAGAHHVCAAQGYTAQQLSDVQQLDCATAVCTIERMCGGSSGGASSGGTRGDCTDCAWDGSSRVDQGDGGACRSRTNVRMVRPSTARNSVGREAPS